MLPILSPDLMRAYRRHGADGRPLDSNAAHLSDLRNARRAVQLAEERARQEGPQRVRPAPGWRRWLALLPTRRPA